MPQYWLPVLWSFGSPLTLQYVTSSPSLVKEATICGINFHRKSIEFTNCADWLSSRHSKLEFPISQRLHMYEIDCDRCYRQTKANRLPVQSNLLHIKSMDWILSESHSMRIWFISSLLLLLIHFVSIGQRYRRKMHLNRVPNTFANELVTISYEVISLRILHRVASEYTRTLARVPSCRSRWIIIIIKSIWKCSDECDQVVDITWLLHGHGRWNFWIRNCFFVCGVWLVYTVHLRSSLFI